ncbi:hypothetical protein E3T28_12120 [Cryobacterium sinapicolor]|uniref:Uncharacterized protein n=1 Tax=Cryobacterium sinapicolor TaxID=1259236 RepID=A0ABY2IYU9_9MICO|nr:MULTISPECIES: hypothetical protein [Cryobacterium]TFC85137.1 hypothetical protein E3O67_12200 [Cryobacterium sp. TMT3-29-2]TFC96581.1 hypothetical protein E3T28_12120 [Cryobacterium sinapicolor]
MKHSAASITDAARSVSRHAAALAEVQLVSLAEATALGERGLGHPSPAFETGSARVTPCHGHGPSD